MPYKNIEDKRAAQRRFYSRNKQYFLNKNKRRKRKILDLLKQAKNRPCFDCGKTYPYYVMDFDHREPDKKSFQLTMIRHKQSLKLMKTEMEKCDVVCANCHRIRTHAGSDSLCGHQTCVR